MNFPLAVACCLVSVACGQLVDPKSAKILKEQRFNTGDGRFGSAFAQEDGVVFREETSSDGERIGQYSYIDLDGKTITVKYTAGKDGFRIIEGAHVPTGANGLNSAPFDPNQAAVAAPVAPQATPLRQAPLRQAPAPIAQPIDYDYADEPVDPNFNPFINPHDPTHRNFQFNQNGANFAPKFAPSNTQFSSSAVPNCANCAGVNPFINPFDASHRQPVQQTLPAQPAFRQPAQPTFAQQAQPTFNQAAFLQPTTQAPSRFFPPGQLQLNRFETGFNFDFSS